MPVQITIKELAASCQVFYRKIYGFFYSELMPHKFRTLILVVKPIAFYAGYEQQCYQLLISPWFHLWFFKWMCSLLWKCNPFSSYWQTDGMFAISFILLDNLVKIFSLIGTEHPGRLHQSLHHLAFEGPFSVISLSFLIRQTCSFWLFDRMLCMDKGVP